MTRPSRRELERAIDALDPTDDGNVDTVVIETTVVGTEHSCSDLAPGETRTETKEIEIR